MRTTMKRMLFALSVVALAASCSSSDDALEGKKTVAEDPNYPIIASSRMGRTRLVVEPSATTNLKVSMFRIDETAKDQGYPTGFATVSGPHDATLEGDTELGTATITFDGTKRYYLEDGTKTSVLAVYPAIASTAWSSANGEVQYSIDGKTDVLATAWGEGYKNTSLSIAVQPSGMAFNHLLTQVRIKIYAEDAAGATFWGDVKNVYVKERQSVLTVSLPDGGAATYPTILASGATFNVPMFNLDGSVVEGIAEGSVPVGNSADAALLGYAIFAPETTATELTLEIVTEFEGQEIRADIPLASRAYEAGKAYQITLMLREKKEILPTVTITAWEEVDGGVVGV